MTGKCSFVITFPFSATIVDTFSCKHFSMASRSSLKASNKLFKLYFSLGTFLVKIRLNSCGSLLIRMGSNKPPYSLLDMPNVFNPLMFYLMRSYTDLSLFVSELLNKGSFSKASMFKDMITSFDPKRSCSTSITSL